MTADYVVTDLIIHNDTLYQFRNLFQSGLPGGLGGMTGIFSLLTADNFDPNRPKFKVETATAPLYIEVRETLKQPAADASDAEKKRFAAFDGVVMTLKISCRTAKRVSEIQNIVNDLPHFAPVLHAMFGVNEAIQIVGMSETITPDLAHTLQVRAGSLLIFITHADVVA